MALRFEPVDQSCPGIGGTPPSLRAPAASAKGLQSSFLEPMLMSSNGPLITTEGSSHIVLVGPALLHEVDHRVGLSHAIGDHVLREDRPRDENYAVIALRPDQAAVVDDDRAFRRYRTGKEVMAEIYESAKKRTGLGSHPEGGVAPRFQRRTDGVMSGDLESSRL